MSSFGRSARSTSYRRQQKKRVATCGAGLLSKHKLLAGALPGDLRDSPDLINEEEGGGEDLEGDYPPLALAADDL